MSAPVFPSQDMPAATRQDVPVLDREIWTTCNMCCGEGGWDEPRPQWDDPNFCVVVKCPPCNGTGWECDR